MAAELKPHRAYKDSGVEWLGQMPAHWKVLKLRQILRRHTERGRPDLPLLSVVRERGVILRDTTSSDENHNYIPDDLSNYKVVRAGQFVMNKMKAWQGSYGVSRHDGIVSPAYFVFGVFGLRRDFFHAAVRSRAYVPAFTRASDGVRIGQWDLAEARMRDIRFLVPPASEQAAISTFLDHADRRIQGYIRAKKKLIGLLEDQKQAMTHQAVTGQIDVRTGRPYPACRDSGVNWLGDVPEHWDTKRLKWVTRLQRGYDLPADKRVPGEVPVVSSGGIIDTHSESRCVGPGVVMGRYGSTDAVFYVERDFWPHNTSLFVTEFWGNDRKWCFHLLSTITKEDQAGKSAVPGLDRKDLFRIVVPVPPLGEQREIVRVMERTGRKLMLAISNTERLIDAMRAYLIRLVGDVVTGKLDVRGEIAGMPDADPLAGEEDPGMTTLVGTPARR